MKKKKIKKNYFNPSSYWVIFAIISNFLQTIIIFFEKTKLELFNDSGLLMMS